MVAREAEKHLQIAQIAVVDDERIVLERLTKVFSKEGYKVEAYSSGEELLGNLKHGAFDLVFLDVKLPGIDGMEVLRRIKAHSSQTEVILITGHASIDSAVEAIKLGAFHYVSKPLKVDEVRHLAHRALEHNRLMAENQQLKLRLESLRGYGDMVGVSSQMKEVFRIANKIAPLDCNVLIQGASGTGKELVARLVHRESPRRLRPFVAFNCAGFTEELIASELFGYERGAFTGAAATKIGLLEAANRGTVFMDEIGDMPLSMQVKLLRAIQEKEVVRVGGTSPIQLDLRFVAASNKDLKREVGEGRFREDLYFRLKVVEIVLPKLRERREDIRLLINHFLGRYNRKFSKTIDGIDQKAMDVLMSYSYPGNVRELENIIERAVALAEGKTLGLEDLPLDLQEYSVNSYEEWITLEEKEREYIRKVLGFTRHNMAETARILGLPRTSLWRKIRRYGLSKSR